MIFSLPHVFLGDALKARASRSAAWTICGILSTLFLGLVSNLILTRLLFPEAFGMMALVQVFIAGLAAISDMGIRASIIQSERSRDSAFLNTAWTLQILRGGILWFLSFAIALPVAALYEEPVLAGLLPVAGLTALILGFTPTRIATNSRDLIVGRMTVVEVVAQLFGIISTVGLAWALNSVWALVLGPIMSALLKQALLRIALPGHRDRLQIDRSALGELITFGKWIILSSVLGFFVNNADRAILGNFITLEMLGIYSVGLLIASVPMLLMQPLASNVLLPIYKQRPPWESVENWHKISRMRWFLTGALLTISLSLVLGGNLLVVTLFDERYELAGPILVLMAIAQLPAVVLSSYDQILLAAGDSRRFMNRIAILSIVQTTLLVLGATQFGLIGAILARGLSSILVYPYMLIALYKYQGWDRLHDIVYGAAVLVIAALGLWVNEEVIQQLVAETIP